jgi:O-antigen/teichoic acid export membrane protein
MALIIAIIIVATMMTLGPWFLTHWTGGHVPPSRGLVSILLLVVIANSLWSTSSTLLAAVNQHQRLAAWYLFGTSITVVLTYLLAKHLGLYWAAASLLVSELVMNFYVLPATIRLSHDTPAAFFASMLHYPQSLRLGTLMSRLRRAPTPGLNPPEESV